MSTYLDSYDQIGLVNSNLSNTEQKPTNVQPANYNIEIASSNGSRFTQELLTSQCMDFEQISNNNSSNFLLDSNDESIQRFNEQLELDNNAIKEKRKIANSTEPYNAVTEENVNTSRNVPKRLCLMDDTCGDKHLQILNNQHNVNDDDPFPYLYAHNSSHIKHTNNTSDNLNNCSTNKFTNINRNFQHSTVSNNIISETNVDRNFNSLLVNDELLPNIQSICDISNNEAKLTIDTVSTNKDYNNCNNTNYAHNINSRPVVVNIISTHTEYDNVIQPDLIPIQTTTTEPLNEYISSSTPVETNNNSDLYKNWDKLIANIKNTTNITEKLNYCDNNDDVALIVNQISDEKIDIDISKEIIPITDLINDNNNNIDDVDLNNQNAALLINQISDEQIDLYINKEIITFDDLINDNINNEDDVDQNNQISDENTDIAIIEEIIPIIDLINDNNNNEDEVDLNILKDQDAWFMRYLEINKENIDRMFNMVFNNDIDVNDTYAAIDVSEEIIPITDLINDNNNNKDDVDLNNQNAALLINQISDEKIDIDIIEEIIPITDLINDNNNNNNDVDLNNQNAALLINQISDEKIDLDIIEEIIPITDLINDNKNNNNDVDLNNQNAALLINQISDEKIDIDIIEEIIPITDLINDNNNNKDDVDLNNQNAALLINQISDEKIDIDIIEEIIPITDLINDNNNNNNDVDLNNQNAALIVYQINDKKVDIVSKKEIIVNTDKINDSNSEEDDANNIRSISSDTENSDSSTDVNQIITWIGKPIRRFKYHTFYKQIEILCEGNVTDVIAIADSVSIKTEEKHVRYYGKINALFEVRNGEKRKSMTKLMWYYQTKDIAKEVPETNEMKLSDNALFTSNHYTDVATCTIVGQIQLYSFAKYRNLRTKNYKMDFYVAGNYNAKTKKIRYLKNAS